MERPQFDESKSMEECYEKKEPQSALQPTLTSFRNLDARLINVNSVELKKEEKDGSKNKALT
jgi:hypothetical protein